MNTWSRLINKCNRTICDIRASHITIETDALFWSLHVDGLFQRYDSIVRLLAIEDYYNGNAHGFDMYKKMQCRRLNIDNAENYYIKFIALIKSYQTDGYNNKSEIVLDRNLTIIDGSHRFAMALYNEIPLISAKVYPISQNVSYGIDWFEKNGFVNKECMLLQNKYSEIRSKFV